MTGPPWRANEDRLHWLWSLTAGSICTVMRAVRGCPIHSGAEVVDAVRKNYLVCAGRRFSLRTGGEVGGARRSTRLWIEPWGDEAGGVR